MKVCIDRSIRPIYPSWVYKVLHPELEGNGPPELDLSKIELWIPDDQKIQPAAWIQGDLIYEYLQAQNLLDECLGLRDGEEILKQGLDTFTKFFAGKSLFLWKSVALDYDHDGGLEVPYLQEFRGQVVISWTGTMDYLSNCCVAARFA